MVIQIDAEVSDSLEDCTAKAKQLANRWQLNVTFYYDRVGYYVTPSGVVSVVATTLREKKG